MTVIGTIYDFKITVEVHLLAVLGAIENKLETEIEMVTLCNLKFVSRYLHFCIARWCLNIINSLVFA